MSPLLFLGVKLMNTLDTKTFNPDTILLYDTKTDTYIKFNGITSANATFEQGEQGVLYANFIGDIEIIKEKKQLENEEYENILFEGGEEI